MWWRKIGRDYFNRDYWMVKGKRSGYSPEEGYTRQDFQWEAIAKMLIGVFGKDNKYLEAGCAFGWIIEWLNEFGVDAWGFDISEYAVEHAPDNVKVCVVCSDGFDLPYTDNEFDVLFTLETAEHLHPDDVDKWWRELYRVLRPGGKVFAAVCVGRDNKRGIDDPDRSHRTLQSIEWWYKTLLDIGFCKDEELEKSLCVYEVKTNRLDEPLCLAKYYDWRILGMESSNGGGLGEI